jgi:hypothetical protein
MEIRRPRGSGPPSHRRCWGRYRPKVSRRQKAVNHAHARIRACGERAITTVKTWKILAKLRCCPRRSTGMRIAADWPWTDDLVQAF